MNSSYSRQRLLTDSYLKSQELRHHQQYPQPIYDLVSVYFSGDDVYKLYETTNLLTKINVNRFTQLITRHPAVGRHILSTEHRLKHFIFYDLAPCWHLEWKNPHLICTLNLSKGNKNQFSFQANLLDSHLEITGHLLFHTQIMGKNINITNANVATPFSITINKKTSDPTAISGLRHSFHCTL